MCVIFYFTGQEIGKQRDCIIKKFNYHFSFGDLLAIYLCHNIQKSYQNFHFENQRLSGSPSAYAPKNRIGFGFSHWHTFFRIFYGMSWVLSNKQTRESWRSIVNSQKHVQITFQTIIPQLIFSILIFIDFCSSFILCIVPIAITMCRILQLSLSTLIFTIASTPTWAALWTSATSLFYLLLESGSAGISCFCFQHFIS